MRVAKKVFVLWYREYDDSEIYGAYSTRERANEMIRYIVRFDIGRRKKACFEIEECRLDAMAVKVDPKVTKIPRWVRR